MSSNKSELEQIISEIKKSTNQISINKVDEVRVMRSMLNDPEYTIGVYDKNLGYIGQKNPHSEAVNFVKNVIAGATGLDKKDAQYLAENYEFTKRDANYMLSNMRDFLYTYTSTGRKINVIQSANTEANLFTKDIAKSTKLVPDKDNKGQTREVETSAYVKLVSSSKCPKYLSED
jgi:hypothetical protein